MQLHHATNLIASSVFAAAFLLGGQPAGAQQFFKGKTISVIVPSGGGSGLDTMARTVVDSWRLISPDRPR